MLRADLHIHSRFSNSTSKRLTLRNLASFACIKGISLLGTGDITHPIWQKEVEEELVFDSNSGFYRLKKEISREEIEHETKYKFFGEIIQPLFILQAEISCIYKKNSAVRKNHNLIYFPNFKEVYAFSEKLAKIGNIHSDGRPILGLDAKNLLEMTLEHENSYLIPAHVWTPWFSLFGSKSGFNSVEECFDDLHTEIFAMETGLSSDPAMNRKWSELDKYSLISNSDAHSGENLGREVNLFLDNTDYEELFLGLKKKNSNFLGTLEFFPEEGKYFLDGHRNCNICLSPKQSLDHKLICPICNKPLTLGVLHRVEHLADRRDQINYEQFEYIIPLAEILAEILQCTVKTKKVQSALQNCLINLGNELDILHQIPIEYIKLHSEVLALAISKMRNGQITRKPGFDGEYGSISLFNSEELKEFKGIKL